MLEIICLLRVLHGTSSISDVAIVRKRLRHLMMYAMMFIMIALFASFLLQSSSLLQLRHLRLFH